MVTQRREECYVMAVRLSNAQKYSIQGMIADDKTNAEMAKILKVDEKVVVSYIEKLTDSIEKIANNIESFGFVNQTDGGKPGVAIMTETASQKGDAATQKNTKDPANIRTKNTIWQPKEGRIRK